MIGSGSSLSTPESFSINSKTPLPSLIVALTSAFEVHPDPIFGHEAQVYVREADTIEDTLTLHPLGDNLPLTFSFTTGTFILVPPGKLSGIGDKNTIEQIEKSPGWDVK